jgi:osmotically-inducible protein OsmY
MRIVRPGTSTLFCVFFALLLSVAPIGAAEEELTDDLIYDRVNRALITDRELGARQLEVTVENGKVRVTGFVESEKQQKRVDKVVKKVKGVVSVDNKTQIRPYL